MDIKTFIIDSTIFHFEDDENTVIGYEIATQDVYRNIDEYYFNLKHFTRTDLMKLVELCTVEVDKLKTFLHDYDNQLISIKLNSMKNYKIYLQKKIKLMIMQMLINYYYLIIRASNKKVKRMRKLK